MAERRAVSRQVKRSTRRIRTGRLTEAELFSAAKRTIQLPAFGCSTSPRISSPCCPTHRACSRPVVAGRPEYLGVLCGLDATLRLRLTGPEMDRGRQRASRL